MATTITTNAKGTTMSDGYTMKPANEPTVVLRGEAKRYARMSGTELWAELKTRNLPQWEMARLITPIDMTRALVRDDNAKAAVAVEIEENDEPAGATLEQIEAVLADETDLDW